MPFLPLVFLLFSCQKEELPSYFFGEWLSGEIDITVRIEPRMGQFEFIDGTGIISLTVREDETVDGHIGTADFQGAPLDQRSGVYGSQVNRIRIMCDSIGEIFPGDPLENKEVEIWMDLAAGSSDAELRFTEGMANFPMASMTLTKQ